MWQRASITIEEYMQKLEHFVPFTHRRSTGAESISSCCGRYFDAAAVYYKKGRGGSTVSKQERLIWKRVKIKNLYTLEETIAKPLFEGAELSVGSFCRRSVQFILEARSNTLRGRVRKGWRECLDRKISKGSTDCIYYTVLRSSEKTRRCVTVHLSGAMQLSERVRLLEIPRS